MRLLGMITAACVGVIPFGVVIGLAGGDSADLTQASSLIMLIGITGLALAGGPWWVLCLVEILKTPEPQWQAAGQSRLVYVLLMLFLSLLGAVLYYFIARPALAAAHADADTAEA